MLPQPTLQPDDSSGNIPDTGDARKRDALTKLEVRRCVYVRRGRRALLTRLLETGTATIDDVRIAVPLPHGIRPVLFGSVPGPLAEAGIITAVDFVPTKRKEGHARHVRRWRLIEADAAVDWLCRHPDLPDNLEATAPAGS